MSISSQRACAWCGPALTVIFFIGFWLVAGFIPPPAPHEGANQIAGFFQHNTTRIHLGLLITMMASALVGPWATSIAVQLKRIEGRYSPLAYLELGLGAILILEFIVPLMIWQGIDFRPYASPDVTLRLDDIAWLMFVGVVSTGILQAIVIGAAILKDKHEQPILPHWIAYVNFWCALAFVPGGLIVFFKHGPFGWNGLISWWMLLTAYWIWTVANSYAVLKHAIPHQQHEDALMPAGWDGPELPHTTGQTPIAPGSAPKPART
jgi:hypothetical protein